MTSSGAWSSSGKTAVGLGMLGWCCVSAMGLVVGSPALVVGPALGGACTWHSARTLWRRRETRRRRSELIDEVDQLIQKLKSGSSLSSALAEHHLALAPAEPGAAMRDGWPSKMEADHRLLVATLTVLKRRGGPALPSLQRLSDTLRSSAAAALETEAQAGQATASALALAALPGLFIVGLAMAQDALRQFYLHDVAGTACLLGAGALSYLGWAVMQHLIESAR